MAVTNETQVEVTQADRLAASYTTSETLFGQSIMAGRQDNSRLVQAFARHRIQAEKRNNALADALRAATEDEADAVSLSVWDWPDGRSLTQSKTFVWGDHVLILGELGAPNTWNDEAFEAAEACLIAALEGDE